VKIKLERKVIELTELSFDYLFPYLVRFCILNGLGTEWKNDTILISKEILPKFNSLLEELLEQLLTECYKEPTQKEVWTDDKLEKALKEAIQDVSNKSKLFIESPTIGLTSEGYGIVFTTNNGKVTNFWFD